MTNQLSQWYQYPNAYSKDNSHYTYMMDDGSAVTLTAGKDGVTEDWIAQIKAYHIEEMNMLRRGRSKGEGQNFTLALTKPGGPDSDWFWQVAYSYSEATEASPLTSSRAVSNWRNQAIRDVPGSWVGAPPSL